MCALVRRTAITAGATISLLLTLQSAHAGTLDPIKLRVSGKEITTRVSAIFDGREVYIPLEALKSLGLNFVITTREESAVVFKGNFTVEIGIARPTRTPMLPMSAIAQAFKLAIRTAGGACDVAPAGRTQAAAPERPVSPRPSIEYPLKNVTARPPENGGAASGHQITQMPRKIADWLKAPVRVPAAAGGQLQIASGPDSPAEVRPSHDSGAISHAQFASRRGHQGTLAQGGILVQDVSFEPSDADHARLTIKTSGKPYAFVSTLRDPARLTVDLKNTALAGPSRDIPVNHPFANGIHVTQGDSPSTSRVTVDLRTVIGYNIVSTTDEGIVINLALAHQPGRAGDLVVVIDPGHGGDHGNDHDGCSTTATGQKIYEKHLTLEIARKVQQRLEEAGITVIMTRTADEWVDLSTRARTPSAYHAQMFVSIHVDWLDSPSPTASGSTAYYHMDDQNSRALAQAVIGEVAAVTGLPNRHARSDRSLYTSGLAVLRENTVPATLLEVGFLSNPRDRAKLLDSGFQDQIAQAVARGIRAYAGGGTPDTQPDPAPLTEPSTPEGVD